MGEWVRAASMLPEILALLLIGAVTTIEIAAAALLIAVALGLALALVQRYSGVLPRAAIRIYIEVFRGVPVLTQLFVLYFGLTEIGIRLTPLMAAIVGFGLNGGAYLTEVFRSGLQAVPRGQTEAALMIGMTKVKLLRYVVLPQAMRVALPPLANYAVGLLKETALASAVAAPELTFFARSLVTKTYLGPQIYLVLASIYIAMSVPLSRLAGALERRFGRGGLAT